MRLIYYIAFLFLVSGSAAYSSEPISIRFVPTYDSRPIVLQEKWYKLADGDSLMIETVRFYISELSFYKEGKIVYREKDSYHLVDGTNEGSMSWIVQAPDKITYDAIGFNLGIDSITNISGVQGGVLDPSNGMYWAWQSGYINLKLEGKSNVCPTRKNIFQFHLGGYMLQDYAMQRIMLNTSSGKIIVGLPIDKCLSSIDLRTQNSIMIPCPDAVNMSKRIAKLFEVVD